MSVNSVGQEYHAIPLLALMEQRLVQMTAIRVVLVPIVRKIFVLHIKADLRRVVRAVEGVGAREQIHIPRVRRAEIPVPVLTRTRKDTVPWCQEIIVPGILRQYVQQDKK